MNKDQENIRIYYDMKEKEIGLDYPQLAKLHDFSGSAYIQTVDERVFLPLGYLLIKYLELEQTSIDMVIDEYFKVSIPSTSEELETSLESIMTGFNELIKLHPYYTSLRDSLQSNIDIYIKESERVMASGSAADKALIDKTITDIRDPIEPIEIDLLRNAIEFSFFDTTYKEFRTLYPLERFMIFDNIHHEQLSKRAVTQEISSLYSVSPDLEELKYKRDLSLDDDDYRKEILKMVMARDKRNVLEYKASPLSALILELSLIFNSGKTIKKCQNCNKLFVPELRETEVYCTRRNPEGKSCRDIGWINKEKSIEFEIYREYYKKFNKYKNMNSKAFTTQVSKERGYTMSLETIFQTWTEAATEKREKLSRPEISSREYDKELTEYISWLRISYKNIKDIVRDKTIYEEYSFLINNSEKDLKKWLESLKDDEGGIGNGFDR